jgi:hypothetical protein
MRPRLETRPTLVISLQNTTKRFQMLSGCQIEANREDYEEETHYKAITMLLYLTHANHTNKNCCQDGHYARRASKRKDSVALILRNRDMRL